MHAAAEGRDVSRCSRAIVNCISLNAKVSDELEPQVTFQNNLILRS